MNAEEKDRIFNSLCEKARRLTGYDIRYQVKIRKTSAVYARGIISVILHLKYRWTLSEIGERLHHHHSSIIHARDAHNTRMLDDVYRDLYEQLLPEEQRQREEDIQDSILSIIDLLDIVKGVSLRA